MTVGVLLNGSLLDRSGACGVLAFQRNELDRVGLGGSVVAVSPMFPEHFMREEAA